MPDPFEPAPSNPQPLEEALQAQVLGVDLKQSLMACLSGEESRRWTVAELVERLKNLGICASRARVTAALAELEVELEIASWAPWRLVERGPEWILTPKSELLALLSGARKLPVKAELSKEHKAVLLVVIGHRRKGGVSKTRIAEILALDPCPLLDDLLGQELVYLDPARRELNFWRPTPSALLALGLRSFTDIPALKELEDWFDAMGAKSPSDHRPALDSYFRRTSKLSSRRLKRDLERRQSVGFLAGSHLEKAPAVRQEGSPDLLRPETTPLPDSIDHESPERIVQDRPAQGAPAGAGEKQL